MSIYDRTIENIEKNKRIKEEGGFNCIPFELPRFEGAVPGIMQETYYLISANSGIGKSQFVRKKFMIDPFDFIMNNPESGIDLKIFYFSMEESADMLLSHVICNRLYEKYNILIDINQLRSIGRDSILPDEVLEKIKETREYFEPFEDKVDIIDGSINPFGIYSRLRNYALANGEIVYKDKVFEKEDGSTETKKVTDYYVPNNPNEYVMCIVDHMSLLNTERGSPTKHDTIGKLSSEYFVPLRNRFGHIPVGVQQQASDSEKMQYTVKGDSINEKVEPSLDGLGDNKKTQRDADVVLGLFAPNRHNIEKHAGYDIVKLQDNYRSLSILKNRRFGVSNGRTGLYFDGRVNYFKELPRPDDDEKMERVLEFIRREKSR